MSRNRDKLLRAVTTRDSIPSNSVMLLIADAGVEIHCEDVNAYATSADFCRIFQAEMSSLYLLSLLLTADSEKAERCFLESLEDSAGCTSVFKEWANSWARRTIIHNAIRLIGLRRADEISIPNPAPRGSVANVQPEIAAAVDLPAFERFVFVLSVFERFSDQDCSLLLNCSRREVAGGRNCVLRRIANLENFEREEIRVSRPSEARLRGSAPFVSLETTVKVESQEV
jgi:hypothetical protein